MYTLFVTCDLDWSHIGIDQLMEVALILYSVMNLFHVFIIGRHCHENFYCM